MIVTDETTELYCQFQIEYRMKYSTENFGGTFTYV